ncbi:MAG: ABC transporter permease [Phycisphaeraceae bacterium]|nr:ABC transporter permease [Phycisphaeraceae bacterium]
MVRTLMIIPRLTVQTVFLALGQIWANKVRSMLTTLGIIIGVASIIAVVAALTGLRASVLSEFEKFGARKVFIDGRVPRELRNRINFRDVQLTLAELDAVEEHCPSIEKLTPMMMMAKSAEAGDTKLDGVQTTGIWPTWHDIEGRAVLIGRPFNEIDERERRDVCLVNEKLIEDLGLDRDPTTQTIRLSDRVFTIVGVVETVTFNIFGSGESNAEIFIPLATAMRLNPNGWINFAWAQMRRPDQAQDAIAEISTVMRKVRGLEGATPNTFEVRVIQQFIDGFNRVAGAVTAGAGGVVGISLLVGGIGIMNIMLVSVSERTREIGLRKAVGARPSVVLLQFLVEAVTLCLVGGAVGIALGQLMVLGIRNIPGADLGRAVAPAWVIVLSVGFSAATGIVFGMFPALKAARLDPIEALRHE